MILGRAAAAKRPPAILKSPLLGTAASKRSMFSKPSLIPNRWVA
jgi:hypothetical protein